jgi:hypothetical protein
MKGEQALQIVEALKKTPIGRVNEIFIKRDFINPPDEVMESDEVIGELTDYEKAMFTFLERLIDENNEMGNKLTNLAMMHNQKSVVTLSVDFRARERSCEILEELETISSIFWVPLAKRLSVELDPENLFICKGWKVVIVKNDNEAEEAPIIPIK